MLKIGPKYDKLKTSLQLASNRLQILRSKKENLSARHQSEIADYLRSGKDMLAVLNAHKLIREVAFVEALELTEMHCEEILDKYELFKKQKVPDASLMTPICSLIWVAPYLKIHVEELKCISKQLRVKYGNHFAILALTNQTTKVNPDLVKRVRIPTASDEAIDNCLKKISKKYGVIYKRKSAKDNHKKTEANQFGHSDSSAEEKENDYTSRGTKLLADGTNKEEMISSKKFSPKIMLGCKTARRKNSSEAHSNSSNHEEVSGSEIILNPPTKDEQENRRSYLKSPSFSFKDSEKRTTETESCLDCKKGRIGEADQSFDFAKPEKYNICESQISPFLAPVSNFSGCVYHSLYSDPPPPYTSLNLSESSLSSDNSQASCEYFNFFPLPTCPSEEPESQDFNETMNLQTSNEK